MARRNARSPSATRRGARTRPRSRSRRRSKRRPWIKRMVAVAGVAGVAGAIVLAGYVAWLDFRIRDEFEGKRWAVPARLFAPPAGACARGAADGGCDPGGAGARRIPAGALRIPARELRAGRRTTALRDPRFPVPRRRRPAAQGVGLRVRRARRGCSSGRRGALARTGRSGRDRPDLPRAPRGPRAASPRRRPRRVPGDPAGGRGPPVLRAPRDRPTGDPARGLDEPARRPHRAGRQHPDPATRQELFSSRPNARSPAN